MTREEAIRILKNIAFQFGSVMREDNIIAVNMAIEALSERNIAREIATILENEQDMRVILQNDAVNEDTQTERRVDHDRDWIIGCIQHDGFIHTHRFDKANQIILDALEKQSVVRCKDCKNWRESHIEDEESYCYIDGRTTDSTDYCSMGERKENANTD